MKMLLGIAAVAGLAVGAVCLIKKASASLNEKCCENCNEDCESCPKFHSCASDFSEKANTLFTKARRAVFDTLVGAAEFVMPEAVDDSDEDDDDWEFCEDDDDWESCEDDFNDSDFDELFADDTEDDDFDGAFGDENDAEFDSDISSVSDDVSSSDDGTLGGLFSARRAADESTLKEKGISEAEMSAIDEATAQYASAFSTGAADVIDASEKTQEDTIAEEEALLEDMREDLKETEAALEQSVDADNTNIDDYDFGDDASSDDESEDEDVDASDEDDDITAEEDK